MVHKFKRDDFIEILEKVIEELKSDKVEFKYSELEADIDCLSTYTDRSILDIRLKFGYEKQGEWKGLGK